MAYTNNLTEETKALLQGNKNNPIVSGANQYMQQSATPRLKGLVSMSRPVNYQPMYNTSSQGSNNSESAGIDGLVKGGMSLMNGLNNLGVFKDKIEENPDSAIGSDIGDIASNAGGIFNMAKTWGNSGGGAAAGGYGGLISGGINGLGSFAQSGDYKDGIQGFFGTSKDDSDVMQSIKGTLNGAMTGGSVGGPWGAAIGAALGLGSSFLDDI